MELTQKLVQELLDYNPRKGTLVWRPRHRKWFNSTTAWQRWNNRYANQPAFTYIAKGYRWGSMFDKNQLAHRVVWLYVYGVWPQAITFCDGDGTNLKLNNLIDRKPLRKFRVRFESRAPRERLPLAA